MSLSLDPFKDTLHYRIDEQLIKPGEYAVKRAIHIVQNKSASHYPFDLDLRFLAFVQAIVSAIAVPFKIIYCLYLGLKTLYNHQNLKGEDFLNLGYSLTSLAFHTVAIPVALMGVFGPIQSILENMPSEMGVLREALKKFRINLIPNPLDAAGAEGVEPPPYPAGGDAV